MARGISEFDKPEIENGEMYRHSTDMKMRSFNQNVC
jgi:hypothetical protein